MPKATPININDQLAQLSFFASRTPQPTEHSIEHPQDKTVAKDVINQW